MTESPHYVPLLKGKRGEFRALSTINAHDRRFFTPLIDIPIISAYKSKPASPQGHFRTIADHIQTYWGTERGPILVDSRLIEDDIQLRDGRHPFAQLTADVMEAEVPVIPVTGLRRHERYQAAVLDAVALLAQGLCVRLEGDDLSPSLQASLPGLLAKLKVEPEQVDLIIDFREIKSGDIQTKVLAAQAALTMLPNLSWRTLVVAAGAFPASLGSFGREHCRRFPRAEWTFWTKLRNEVESSRPLAYGDYAIAHPEMTDADPRLMRIPIALRYTTAGDYLALKNGTTTKPGAGGFARIAKRLVKMPEYAGSAFSKGDEYIHRAATDPKHTGGNPEKWREVGTSHHLTFVSQQIQALS